MSSQLISDSKLLLPVSGCLLIYFTYPHYFITVNETGSGHRSGTVCITTLPAASLAEYWPVSALALPDNVVTLLKHYQKPRTIHSKQSGCGNLLQQENLAV